VIAVDEALARVLAGTHALAPERVRLADAHGRVLAAGVTAPRPLPPWDNSAMDGYAVRAADVAGATADRPAPLRVLETVAAGGQASRAVQAGTAVRVMTGAPIPDGADCVVRVEDTDGGLEVVVVRDGRDAGRNVRPRGEDLEPGAVALAPGVRLGGAQLALLAAMGCLTVDVVRAPRVAILGSGDELVPPERAAEAAASGRVVATNGLALASFVRRDGGSPLELGVAPDDPIAIAERAHAAETCDLLVTTGGAAIGAFDFTRDALGRLGLELDFWRVRVRPGSQTGFGRLAALGGMPWLGLPGNPVSAQVGYELFVRPLLRTLHGERCPHSATVPVVLEEPVPGSATHLLLPRVIARATGDGWSARLAGPQGTGLLGSTARANALLVVPEGAAGLPAGARGRAIPLGDDLLHAETAPW
jgi:molybdopterin molybdotransferase